jgi:broad specificity phosphatase PhoE
MVPMKELILVRHGQSEYMVKGLTGGWTDAPLTELGRNQARLTGQRLLHLLQGNQFQVYSSDLKRAAETAHIIGEILSKPPVFVPALRELNNGTAASMTREEAERIRHPITDPVMDWIPYPEAESWRMLHNRVVTFMEHIQLQCDTGLLVAHSMVIVSVIHWWLEFEEDIITRVSFDIDPCSITRLRINTWNEKTISKLNDTSHLPLEGIE